MINSGYQKCTKKSCSNFPFLREVSLKMVCKLTQSHSELFKEISITSFFKAVVKNYSVQSTREIACITKQMTWIIKDSSSVIMFFMRRKSFKIQTCFI